MLLALVRHVQTIRLLQGSLQRGAERGRAEGRRERTCSYRGCSANALGAYLLPDYRHLRPRGSGKIPGLARAKAGVLDPEPWANMFLDPQSSLGNCRPE